MKIRVKLNSEKKTLKNVDLETGTGQATVIKHPANGVYTFQLIDLETNLGPQKIITKRVGNNLEIAFDDSKTTDLIIENYYREGLEESVIIGLAEDGQYYAYIPENGLAGDAIPVLKENVLATEVLGGEGFVAAAIPFVLSWPWVAGGLGLLGAVAALAGGGSGGSTGSSGSTGSNSVKIDLVAGTKDDNLGGFKLDWPEGAKTAEVELYPEGSKKPTIVTLTKNEDGSISSDHPDLIPGVAKDQPVVIPADSIKDNSVVNVKALDEKGNVVAERSETSAYDKNSELAVVEKISQYDENGDGKADSLELTLKGPANTKFDLLDAAGNKVGEGEFDTNGDATLPVALDSKNPNLDSLEDLAVVVKENGKNPTTTAVKDTPKEKVEELETPLNTYVPAPELTPSEKDVEDANLALDINLPEKNNVKEIKLDVINPETGKADEDKAITLVKENGKFVAKDKDGTPIAGATVEETEKGLTVTLPKDKVPEGSAVVAKVTNNADDTSAPSNPVKNNGGELESVEPEQPSEKPAIESIKAKDTSPTADNNPEVFEVSGTAQPGSSVTIYVEKDGKKTPIGSATADETGHFTAEVTDKGKGIDVNLGDKIVVGSTDAGNKKETLSDSKDVPAVPAGKEGHLFDNLAPEATVTITTHTEPGDKDGSAKIKVTDMKPGDKLVVGLTDETGKDGTPKKLEFTMDENGKLQPSANNDPALKVVIGADGTITIPEDSLKDGKTISASVVDLANNATEPTLAKVGYDEATPAPTEVTIKAIDTDPIANNTPEKLEVTVKGAKVGDKVVLTDKESGAIIGEVPITKDMTQPDGSFKVPVSLENDEKGVKEVSVTVQDPNKGPSAAVDVVVPAVAEGAEGHTGDKLPPKAPNVSSTPENVSVNGIDPENTDKLTIQATPKGDAAGAPTEVVYTKQPDGSFTPSDDRFPTIPKGATSVDIPRELLPAGEIDVTAKAEDLAGHTSPSPTTPVAALLEEKSTPATITSVKEFDDSPVADNNPERVEIKGTAPKGSEVVAIAKDADGNDVVVGSVKQVGENGEFTINASDIPHKNVDIKDTSDIRLVVTEPGKRASDATAVPTVPATETIHTADKTGPVQPTVAESDNSDKKVELPKDAASATVEYIDNNGNPKTAEITRGEDGTLKSNDPNVTVDGNTVTVKGDATKDNTPVTVTPTDLAGNEGAPLVIGSGSDVPVVDKQPEAPKSDNDTVKPKVNTDGSVEVPPGSGSVTITKDGKNEETIPRNEDGQLQPPEGSNWVVDKDNPNKLVPKETLPEGTNVSASVPTKDNNPPATGTGTVVDPKAPVVDSDGSVTVPEDAKSVEIKKDNGNPVTIPRNENGQLEPPKDSGFKVDENNPNKLVPVEPIQPGTNVSATVPAAGSEQPKVGTNTVVDPTKPEVDTATGGFEVPAGHDAVVTEGNKEPVTIPRDKEGNLVPPAGSNWMADPNNPNKVVPKEPIAPGTAVKVDTSVPKAPSQPKVNEVDHAAGGEAAGGEAPAAKKDVVVEFPGNDTSKLGDKVHLTYTPAGSDKPVVVTFTKTDDGWKAPEGTDLPPVTDMGGIPTLTIPGNKVADGTSVIASAENAQGTARTEDSILPETSTDGDGKQPEAPAEKLKQPTELALEAVDNRQTGDRKTEDPDSFTLTGKVPNAPIGSEVIVTANGKEIARGKTTDADGNFSISFTDTENNITKDTDITVTAQEKGKPETVSESSDPIKPANVTRADQSAPEATVAPVEGGALVTPEKPLTPGDTYSVKVTPAATEGAPKPAATEFVYEVNEDGQLVPKEPVPAAPAGTTPTLNADGTIFVPAKPGATVAVTTTDGANNTNTTDPITVQPINNDAEKGDLPAPSISSTPDKVTVGGIDPEKTEKIVLTLDPKADGEATKEVVYTKQPDGSFKPSDEDFPTIPAGATSVEIPRDKLPQGEVNVVARVEDAAGHSNESINTPVKPMLEQAQPVTTVDSVKHIDDSPVADTNPERFEITGTAPKGVEVIAVATNDKGQEVELGRSQPVGQDGNFTINATDVRKDIDVKDYKDIKLVATEPGKRASEPKLLKDVEPEKVSPLAHAGDNTAPEKPTEVASDNADKKVKLPENTEATVEYTDNNGDKQTANITFDENGNLVSDKPDAVTVSKDPEGNNIVTINGSETKDNTPVTVTPTDLAGNKGEPLVIGSGSNVPVAEENPATPDAPKAPSQPNVEEVESAGENAAEGKKDVKVEFPENAQTGDKVHLTYTPADSDKPVVVTFTKQDDGTWKAPEDAGLPEVKDVDGKPTLIIPGDKVKDGSPVIVSAENAAGTARTEDDVLPTTSTDGDGKPTEPEAPVEKLNTPKDLTLKAVDTRQGGDRTTEDPDSFTLTGKVENAPEGTEVLVKKGEEVVGRGTTDDQGNFTIDFKDNAGTIAKDDQLTVVAQKPDQPETASENPATVTVATVTRADQTPPEATLAPVEGGALVTPVKPLNPGDTFTIKVKAPGEDAPSTTHTYKVNDNGELEATSTDAPAVNENGSILVPATAGSTVSVETTDTAGNTNVPKDAAATNPNEIVIPAAEDKPLPAELTAKPEDVQITAMKDTSNPADGNPETFTVTGRVPDARVGTKVRVFDEDGHLLGEGETKDADGRFEFEVAENPAKDLNTVEAGKAPVSKIFLEAEDKHGNKLPSGKTDEVMIQGPVTAFEDKQAPQTPDVTANPTDGSVTVSIPQENAHPGDMLVVELHKAGSEPNADPVKVTLTKQKDGSWKSDHPELVPDAADGDKSVTIPEAVIADGTPVKAYATDIAGNNSDGATSNQAIAGNDQETTKVPEVTLNAIDTNTTADKTVDVVIAKGKTDPNATVTIKDGETVLGAVTADDKGDFTAIFATNDAALDALKAKKPELFEGTSEGNIVKKDFDSLDDKKLDFSAQADGKKPSVDAPRTVPALEATQDDHPLDETAPAETVKPALGAETIGQDDIVTLPADAAVGDRVRVTYTDEATGKEKEILVEKTGGNAWKLVDPENPATDLADKDKPAGLTLAGNTLTLGKDMVKDGTPIKAVTEDLAGHATEEVTKPANFEDQTTKPTITNVQPIDTATAANNDIDAVLVEGKVENEPGAKVSLFSTDAQDTAKPTKLTDAITAGEDGSYKALLVPKGASDEAKENLVKQYQKQGLTKDQIIEVEALPKVGDKLTAKAQHLGADGKPDEALSEASDPTVLTALKNDADSHPFDTTDPAKATIEVPNDATDEALESKGDAVITLPTKDKGAVAGDTLTINYIPQVGQGEPEAPAKNVVYTFDGENWNPTSVDEKPQTDHPTGFSIANGKLTIDASAIKDDSTVTTKVTDLAGRTSGEPDAGQKTSAQVGQDPEFTPKPVVSSHRTVDTDKNADKSAEKWEITGKAANGSTVYLKDPNGNVIAKHTVTDGTEGNAEENFGTFTFTVTKGNEATPTGNDAPENNAKVTDFDAFANAGKYSISAKKAGAATATADEKIQPLAEVPEGTKVSDINGSQIGADASLYNADANPVNNLQYTENSKTISVTGAGQTKFDGPVEDYFLVANSPASVPGAPQQDPRPFVNGEFTYTSAGLDGKNVVHEGDTTAPTMTVTLNPETSGNEAKRKNVVVNQGDTLDNITDVDKVEGNEKLSFTVSSPETHEGDTITVARYRAGDGVNAAAHREKLTYKFENGEWTLVPPKLETMKGLADNPETLPILAEPQGDNGNKATNFTFVPAQPKVNPGDLFVITYKDYAGNAKQSMKVIELNHLFDSTPETADAPTVYAGTISAAGNKDVELTAANGDKFKPNEHKFRINAPGVNNADKANAVSDGDVVFKPGKDNITLEITYRPENPGANDEVVTIYGYIEGDRSTNTFTFYNKGVDGNKTPIEANLIRTVYDDKGVAHYVLNGNAIKDGTSVDVVGIDPSGKRSDTDIPAGTVAADTSVVSGLDDKTDNEVGAPTVVQNDNNSNIVITPTAAEDKDGDEFNDGENTDAIAYVVTFDATHLNKETTALYGLNSIDRSKGLQDGDSIPEDHGNPQGVNHIVVTRDIDGKWTALLVKGQDGSDGSEAASKLLADALVGRVQGNELPKEIASVDKDSGALTLEKVIVKGTSEVKANAIDSYGNKAEGKVTTTHSSATVVVMAPEFKDLGFGKGLVRFGGNNDKVEISGFLDNDEKITVERTPERTPGVVINDPQNLPAPYTIKLNGQPANAQQLAEKGIVFDDSTGEVRLSIKTGTKPITAKGFININESKEISGILDVASDPTPTTVDPVEATALANGGVSFTPGVDNEKLEVEYTSENGEKMKATLTKNDGNWEVASISKITGTDENPVEEPITQPDLNKRIPQDFSIDSSTGAIVLNADAVKDKTKVSVKGFDKHNNETNPATAMTAIDGNTPNGTEAPTIDEPAQKGDHHLITPQSDHAKVEIKYTPNVPHGSPKVEKTITATLENGGKWVLKDSDGLPVAESIAKVRPDGKIEIVEPLEGETTVKAKGTDALGNVSNEATSAQTAAEAPPAKPKPPAVDPNAGTGEAGANDGTGEPLPELVKPSDKFDTSTSGTPNSSGKPKDPKLGTDKHIRFSNDLVDFKQTDDNDADAYIFFKPQSGNTKTEMQFNVYKMDGGQELGFIVRAIRQDGKIVGYQYETGTNLVSNAKSGTGAGGLVNGYSDGGDKYQPSTIKPKDSGYLIVPELDGQGGFTGGVYVMSNDKYRLIANSPNEPAGRSSDKLSLVSVNDPDNIDQWDTSGNNFGNSGTAINIVSNYGDGSHVKPNTVPVDTGVREVSQKVDLLLAAGGDDKQGSVTIQPKGNATYPITLSVSYVDEDGVTQTATLKGTAAGNWTVVEGNTNHFDVTPGQPPRIVADALKDGEKDGVKVKATEEGKLTSDVAPATPGADYVPPAPPAPPYVAASKPNGETVFDDIEANSSNRPNVTYVNNDILDRNGSLNKESSGLTHMVGGNRGGLLFNTDRKNNVLKITTQPADNNGSENDVILVDGSFGDTGGSTIKTTVPLKTEVYLGAGHDILAVRNSIGNWNSRNEINLGEGNNLLTVGTGADYYKLKENSTATDPAKRYEFVSMKENGPGVLEKLEQPNGFWGWLNEHGGSIYNSTVTAGNGNDVIAIEGNVRGGRAAIGEGAKINLGGGDDAIIIAPNDANGHSHYGEVSTGAIVDFGAGNDYLKAVGMRDGAQVKMGDGNDRVAIDRILSDGTVLDMGEGNDTLDIGLGPNSGEARNGAKINLGAGDDTITFRAKSNLWREPIDQEARFMANLDGGDGYDTFVLATPDQTNIGGSVYKSSITHLSTKYFKNIEEIRMSKGTAVDISIGDLWDKPANASGVALKINGYGPEGQPLRPSAERDALNTNNEKTKYRVVDLGETNTNTGTETYATGTDGIQNGGKLNGYDRVGSAQGYWKQVGTEKDFVDGEAVTYNVYRFGDRQGYDIWIQDGIHVI